MDKNHTTKETSVKNQLALVTTTINVKDMILIFEDQRLDMRNSVNLSVIETKSGRKR